ncbi:uncharacterized protein LACBIDRAFT_313014 [Laccaria bicolor S238N-H82]|uniref:Predicted protein n=1 Tax=Laccaria bicolor (strain S238N-H82 / ATCC MYA-4686) TaxID=486041 RepID=B0DXC4_LACBS|nr:uncharacterized protein LACBIDRAFT_313014 [Laccaria bicolor S238N-H82]EDR00766.1 predicted protein [Laccaria bicolor S238N-H82]|eukprot:XP_001888558.1 predicted protein [Laccaria bicolor S238N-H82]
MGMMVGVLRLTNKWAKRQFKECCGEKKVVDAFTFGYSHRHRQRGGERKKKTASFIIWLHNEKKMVVHM